MRREMLERDEEERREERKFRREMLERDEEERRERRDSKPIRAFECGIFGCAELLILPALYCLLLLWAAPRSLSGATARLAM